MKWVININQIGACEYGFQGKTDLIDWAIIDYIQSWQANTGARRIGEMVWINYKQLIIEMPFLGLTDKSSVSRRIKKLSDLKLIDTFQDEFDCRLYAGITQICFNVVSFKGVDSGKQGVDSGKQGVDSGKQGVDSGKQGVDSGKQGVDSGATFIRYQDTLLDTQSDTKNQEKEHCAKNAQSPDAIAPAPAPENPKPKTVKPEKPKPYYETVEIPEFIDREMWLGWQRERKEKFKSKAAYTEYAINQHLLQLTELQNEGFNANAALVLIRSSVWQGVNKSVCIEKLQAQKNPLDTGSSLNKSGINYVTKSGKQPASTAHFSDPEYYRTGQQDF